MPRDVPGYDSGRGGLEEEVEKSKEEKETVEAKEEEEEGDEMPPLVHQGKLILQNFTDMLHDHYQALHDRMDK